MRDEIIKKDDSMNTQNKNNLVFLAIFSVFMLVPMLAAAQSSTGAVSQSLMKMIGVPDSIATGPPQTIIFYVVLPAILMFIIMYGILDEIKLFYRGGINFAIAVLATLITIPSGLLGQVIIGIYGGGLATLAIITGIAILPAFISTFGSRMGLPNNILELLTAVVYGFVMYIVFGFLVDGPAGGTGGVLKNFSWVRWVFVIGVPILVAWRGAMNRNIGLRMGSELAVESAEIKAAEQAVTRCQRALRDLAMVTNATGAGPSTGIDPATYSNALNNVQIMCSSKYPIPYLQTLTRAQINALATNHKR
ncbi:MAG: hypothetical protein HYT71_01330 [Candidatus Aenigmarchaeota archaeon]|nr:hypothetical protein [Candidatus Aenigmarchaeota archaeon]